MNTLYNNIYIYIEITLQVCIYFFNLIKIIIRYIYLDCESPHNTYLLQIHFSVMSCHPTLEILCRLMQPGIMYIYILYLLKITGHFLARVVDFLVFFVKCKTVKYNFRVFQSKIYKKKKLIIFQFFFGNLHCSKSFRYAFI